MVSYDGFPMLSKELEHNSWIDGQVACGVASMRGFRAAMEDTHSTLRVISEATRRSHRFCGVFDGHAQSREAAAALRELLPFGLRAMKQSQWSTKDGLERLCKKVDRTILRSSFSDTGSTAIFCVLESATDQSRGEAESVLKVALGSVGDSQAVIVHSDYSKAPTVPFVDAIHRPHLLEGEIERIVKAGGFVSNGRVDGELAVSRSFGDARYKRDISRKPADQKVIAVPAVAERIVLRAGDFMLLACDGLFDVMNAQQIDAFIRGAFLPLLVRIRKRSRPENPVWIVSQVMSELAGKLIDEALLRGSRDNITAMILRLVPSSKFEAGYSDRFAKLYIPPIIFSTSPPSFSASVREEVRSYGLDDEKFFPNALVVSVKKLSLAGFSADLTRAQMHQILGPALAKQWHDRDKWVVLGNFGIPGNVQITKTHSTAKQRDGRKFVRVFMKRLFCITGDNRNSVDSFEDRKATRRLSSSIGAFDWSSASNLGRQDNSEVHQELQSRQTSAYSD